MSESEVQLLWRALNDLRTALATLSAKLDHNHELMGEVRTDIKKLATDGCSKAAQYSDHETRIRDVEKSRNVMAGMASLAGAALGMLGQWLIKKI